MTPQEAAYRRRAAEIVRQLGDVTPAAMARVQREVAALRRELLRELADTDGWTAARLPRILQAIERAIAEWVASTTPLLTGAVGTGARLGSAVGAAFAAGLDVGAEVVTPQQIAALQSGIGRLVVRIGEDTRTAIVGEVRGAILGVQRPHEALQRIQAIVPGIAQPIRDRAGAITGYRYAGPAARAETIVRTEVSRAYHIASSDRIEATARRVPGVEKRWISDQTPGRNHRHGDIHGQTVPADQPFSVHGYQLRHPGDPAGPPGEVINCLCRMQPWRSSWGDRLNLRI